MWQGVDLLQRYRQLSGDSGCCFETDDNSVCVAQATAVIKTPDEQDALRASWMSTDAFLFLAWGDGPIQIYLHIMSLWSWQFNNNHIKPGAWYLLLLCIKCSPPNKPKSGNLSLRSGLIQECCISKAVLIMNVLHHATCCAVNQQSDRAWSACFHLKDAIQFGLAVPQDVISSKCISLPANSDLLIFI